MAQVLAPRVESNPRGTKFRIGDEVIYTNGYGLVFDDPRTITGVEIWHGTTYRSVRYYFTPTDTPWYPVAEEQLKHVHGRLYRMARRLIELVLQKKRNVQRLRIMVGGTGVEQYTETKGGPR